MFRGRFAFTILIFFTFSLAVKASKANMDYLARRSELLKMEDGLRLGAESFSKMIAIFSIICLNLFTATTTANLPVENSKYFQVREELIQTEDHLSTGGEVQLNSKEIEVDRIFMKYKIEELKEGSHHPSKNAAGMHFFKAKPLIERSKVFRFLQQMPKGALLHLHNTAGVSSEWIVRNLSQLTGLLRCIDQRGINILTFRENPERHKCTTQYVAVNEERQKSRSQADYNRSFENLINLYTKRPELEYPTINHVWDRFQNMFSTVKDFIHYLPAYRVYLWRLLKESYDDKIIYVELRFTTFELYDRLGQVYADEHFLTVILEVVGSFRSQYPDFLGVKLIYAINRRLETNEVRNRVEILKKFHLAYPNIMIGFDLVGQEDKGKPLTDFIEIFKEVPDTIKFFFHAGETNWYGTSTDLNLFDAILLNTTRIGHGYALMKHPILWKAVKERNIAIEVCPISNQVLHLVWDLRNHPGAFYLSQNIPVVISSDDPGFWGAKGLSYDYYYAIMSLASNQSGLRTLKQLVWNSISYSTLNKTERALANATLKRQWDLFLDGILNENQ
ncbi:adenosine deaminase 2-like isoform X1 [Glossina fuscipes]|uniref:Adenosine deaminase n=2 Tax=Glossina TaxID=7393 RepID=A0A9C6E2Y6_9MUSC|nr:adenosine deaminase 2-like isoform X1 [Glossina fuscipes]